MKPNKTQWVGFKKNEFFPILPVTPSAFNKTVYGGRLYQKPWQNQGT